jgi:hypothetical protein
MDSNLAPLSTLRSKAQPPPQSVDDDAAAQRRRIARANYLSAKHNLEVLGRAVAAERLNVEEMEAQLRA